MRLEGAIDRISFRDLSGWKAEGWVRDNAAPAAPLIVAISDDQGGGTRGMAAIRHPEHHDAWAFRLLCQQAGSLLRRPRY